MRATVSGEQLSKLQPRRSQVESMDSRISLIVKRLTSNLSGRATLREMAGSVNLSVWHFCRVFRHETGTTPAKYLAHARVQQAQYLLEQSFLSVKEVATRVGFTGQTHLLRNFKKLVGVSPTEYRRRYRQTASLADK